MGRHPAQIPPRGEVKNPSDRRAPPEMAQPPASASITLIPTERAFERNKPQILVAGTAPGIYITNLLQVPARSLRNLAVFTIGNHPTNHANKAHLISD